MGDEIPNRMNLDLNLGPFPAADNEPELVESSVNLEDWIEGSVSRLRENLRLRARQRWRSVWRPVRISPETRDIGLEYVAGSSIPGAATMQTGEGSASPEERGNEDLAKSCENSVMLVVDDASKKKETEEKGVGEEGSFFDCNICLDLASNPVVTCCGHLFCWPCLYRWLHVHSDARECPVCKGEVTLKNVTPIYGRGNSSRESQEEEDPTLKIPLRPQGRRVESWRQTVQRNAFSIPMEEMIRRLGSRFDLARDLAHNQPQNSDSVGDSVERHSSLLNRILTSRGMRREQNAVIPPADVVDDVGVRQSSPTNYEAGENRRLSSILMRRSHAHRATTISNLTSTLSSAERLVESYFRYHPVERNEEQPPPPVDDRDSVSSIAAVIHSGSQTVDTNNVEIDSTVSLSTSSSRRRNDSSRVSDVDSGDSRAHRRRRLN